MKLKIVISLQIITLLIVVFAGHSLSGNLSQGPRDLHRFVGSLAGLIGLMVVAKAFYYKANIFVKEMAIITFILSLFAGVMGASLKDTDNYQQVFNLMRYAGVAALITAITTLCLHWHHLQRISKK